MTTHTTKAPAPTPAPKGGKPATARFARRKEAVLAAAIAVLNEEGFKGMTLTDVAARIGLTTTSVTYYYKKKEDLAVACFLDGIQRFGAIVDEAAKEPDLPGRLHRLLGLYLDLQAAVRRDETPPLTIFSDIRALTPPLRDDMNTAFTVMFHKVRDLFDAPPFDGLSAPKLNRGGRTLRGHILMEQLLWSIAWLPRFDVQDFPRIHERMFDILTHGLAGPGRSWAPRPLTIAPPIGADTARETFLRAATPLINERSFRGVSVKEISAKLNVTKGSFYHHMEAKDDIVAACFERTFETVRAAQLAAQDLPGDQWLKLSSTVAALVERQTAEDTLLLRTSALQALPEGLRATTVWHADRVSQRFASMITDGTAEGSIRPVDPFIAAQMVSAAINASADLFIWGQGISGPEIAHHFARPALVGLLAE